MRLGAYPATLKRGSRVSEIYGGVTEISERHRHRYEVNTAYKDRLEQHGLRFSGLSPDGVLPEIVEYEDHPWFIGVQFHPELKSRPFEPHPLFALVHSGRGGAVEARIGFQTDIRLTVMPDIVPAARRQSMRPMARGVRHLGKTAPESTGYNRGIRNGGNL